MSTSTGIPREARNAQTYLPDADAREELLNFAELIRELEAFLARNATSKAALIDPKGRARPIPDEIFRILDQVTNALAAGEGITIVPQGMTMTTQKAADFLGISRPTLVRLLEAGEIAYDKPGRHRRVRLQDLLEYQARFRAERRAALAELARENFEAGLLFGDEADVKRLAEFARE